MAYIFSGHETFHCKSFWLKKGYDYIVQGNSFSDENAVIELGVGKNMVSSIKYWMKSFGLLNENAEVTSFAYNIFDDNNGLDKYLEDRTTLWLLHFLLISQNYASIYNLIFNEMHRSKNEFDISSLENFIKRKCSEENFQFNENTIKKDIRTFIHNYVQPLNNGNIDETYSSLLIDLNLISYYRNDDTRKDYYSFNHRNINLPPYQLIVFIILNTIDDNTIDFRELMYGKIPIGLIMCLTENDMDKLLSEAKDNLKWLVYTEDAGNKQIQIKNRPNNFWTVLTPYYQLVQTKDNAI
jgi:hypothetical protein